MATGAFLGIYYFEGYAHSPRHGCEVAVSLHLRFGIGQPYAAVTMVVADRVFRIISQLFVKRDGVRFQPNHRLVHPEIRHLRRRMPGGAGSQFVPFDQDDVGPAFLCQMVERRTSGNSPAHDDNFGARFHDPSPSSYARDRGAIL